MGLLQRPLQAGGKNCELEATKVETSESNKSSKSNRFVLKRRDFVQMSKGSLGKSAVPFFLRKTKLYFFRNSFSLSADVLTSPRTHGQGPFHSESSDRAHTACGMQIRSARCAGHVARADFSETALAHLHAPLHRHAVIERSHCVVSGTVHAASRT